jgi:hypothetical protein
MGYSSLTSGQARSLNSTRSIISIHNRAQDDKSFNSAWQYLSTFISIHIYLNSLFSLKKSKKASLTGGLAQGLPRPAVFGSDLLLFMSMCEMKVVGRRWTIDGRLQAVDRMAACAYRQSPLAGWPARRNV